MSPGFVLALVAEVGGVMIVVISVVGLIVCWLVHALDEMVNGWSHGRGDDGGDGPYDPPPPPDKPTGIALDEPAPGGWSGVTVNPSSGNLAAGRVDLDRLARDQAYNSAAAPHLAEALRHLAGAAADELAPYRDPLPDHRPDCDCRWCTYRLAERYAAATVDGVIERLRPPRPGEVAR